MPSRSDSSDHTELVLASGTNFPYQCETQHVRACTVPLLKESVLMYRVKLVPELPSLLLILLSFLRSHQSSRYEYFYLYCRGCRACPPP
jgi:hypothetical protein